MNRKRLLFLGAIIILFLSTPKTTTASGPWYVTTGGSDTNDCLSSTTPCATINGAIGKVTAGDLIYVAGGEYTGFGDAVVTISKNIFLSGGWDDTFTAQGGTSILDGENARRVLMVNGETTTTIEQFTIQNGHSDNGAGIFNNGHLTVWDSTIQHNIAENGLSPAGGGVFVQSGAVLMLNNSTVNENTASSGAGIFSAWGTVYVNNSTVSGNVGNPGDQGGGINNVGGYLEVSSTTITNNTVGAGGGIHSEAGGTVNMRNSILSGNTADHGPDCDAEITSHGYNMIGDTAICNFIATVGDLTNEDPLLEPLTDNGGYTQTHSVFFGSLADNGGNPQGCKAEDGTLLTTDQRHLLRIGICDIGAYEYQGEVYRTYLPIISTP